VLFCGRFVSGALASRLRGGQRRDEGGRGGVERVSTTSFCAADVIPQNCLDTGFDISLDNSFDTGLDNSLDTGLDNSLDTGLEF
jgi:hypothetical protein